MARTLAFPVVFLGLIVRAAASDSPVLGEVWWTAAARRVDEGCHQKMARKDAVELFCVHVTTVWVSNSVRVAHAGEARTQVTSCSTIPPSHCWCTATPHSPFTFKNWQNGRSCWLNSTSIVSHRLFHYNSSIAKTQPMQCACKQGLCTSTSGTHTKTYPYNCELVPRPSYHVKYLTASELTNLWIPCYGQLAAAP